MRIILEDKNANIEKNEKTAIDFETLMPNAYLMFWQYPLFLIPNKNLKKTRYLLEINICHFQPFSPILSLIRKKNKNEINKFKHKKKIKKRKMTKKITSKSRK